MVLIYLAVHPRSTAREVSDRLGITERQVFRIVRDLEEADLLGTFRGKAGRNTYVVNLEATFHQPALDGVLVKQLVKAIGHGFLEFDIQSLSTSPANGRRRNAIESGREGRMHRKRLTGTGDGEERRSAGTA
jgi:hypothetical protein